MKLTTLSLTLAALALGGAALAQGPGKMPPPPPPAHVSKVAHHTAHKAPANPNGIVWDAKTRHFVDKSGKTVSKAEAHKAGVRGPATTPPSHPKRKAAPTPAPATGKK